MSLFKNAAPMFIPLGANDLSKRVAPVAKSGNPQHLPKFYFFAEKGPETVEYLDPGFIPFIYGSATLDYTQPFYKHVSLFIEGASSTGNKMMLQRVMPRDAGVRSNISVYLDVLETELDVYKRDSKGNIIVDEFDKPIIDESKPKIKGRKIKWITDFNTTEEPTQEGLLTPKAGTMEGIRQVQVPSETNFEEVEVGTGEFENVEVRDPDNDTVQMRNITDIAEIKEGEFVSQLVHLPSMTVIGTLNTVYDEVEFKLQDGSLKLGKELGVDDLLDPDYRVTLISETGLDPELVENLKTNPGEFVIDSIEVTKRIEAFKTIQKEIMKIERVPVMETVNEKFKSTMYPVFEVRAKYRGAYYNNIGFSINTLFGKDYNADLGKAVSHYPYKLSLYTRANENVSPKVFRTFSGEDSMTFVLNTNAVINPALKNRVDLKKVFDDNWYNDDASATKPYKPSEYEYFYFYEDNLNTILQEVLKTEKEFINKNTQTFDDGLTGINFNWYDFDVTKDLSEQFRLLNLFTCKTSKNVNLQTVKLANGLNDKPKLRDNLKEVNMAASKPILLEGGSNGTMSLEELELLVSNELDDYIDINSRVQHMGTNIESCLYDTGFELDCKMKFSNVIALRKDTFVGLTTHRASLGNKCDGLADQRAIATAINTALKLAPESSYYGTSTARAFIVLGCGKLKDDRTDDYVPLLYEFFIKMCRFAGASNGKWNRTELFDRGEKANIKELYKIQPEFIPEGYKPMLWESQVIWAQSKDRETYYFPAAQTVYDDDTSILNSVFTILGLCTCTKIAERAHAEFSGDSRGLSNDEFKQEVDEYLEKETSDKFAGILKVVPYCIIDEDDEKRGYTWHIVMEIKSSPMRTVCIYTSELYRLEN